VQAFIGRCSHGQESAVAKIQRLGAKAADPVHQQTDIARPAQFAQPPQIVEPPGGGFVVHDGQVRERDFGFRGIEQRCDGFEIRRLHPIASQTPMRDPILRADSRHAFTVDAVLDYQHTP
jgi:hypothetical protein